MRHFFVLTLLVLSSCTESVETQVHDDEHEQHDHGISTTFVQSSSMESFTQLEAFKQVGVSFDSIASDLEYEESGIWKPATITFSEGKMKVAVVKLEAAQNTIRFRSSAPFEHASFQFYKEIMAKPSVEPVEPIAAPTRITRALAPASLVISRAEWGSRNPDKVCGQAHTPKYLTVHHTSAPDSDGPDPAARLRQMQAYHMDSNGWCDIGYHFVVSQSGKIYQGISSEKRSGIHVGNHNFENIGVSLIGNFEEQTLDGAQLDGLTRILGWAANEYNIPFERPSFRGHQEWAGASTDCPGTNTLNKLDEIIRLAEESLGNPIEPCTQLGEDGGEIDNDSDCFQQFGNAEFWRSEAQGYGGGLIWTNAFKADNPSNSARWNINLEKEGKYKLEYYSVPEFAIFSSTQYGLAHAENEVGITIDQSVGLAGWNSLGEFDFNSGANQWLAVYDNSPFEVGEDQHIVADAIRLTRIETMTTNTNNETTTDTTQTATNGSNNGTNSATNNSTSSTNNNSTVTTNGTNDSSGNTVEDGCSTSGSTNVSIFLFGILFLFRRKKKSRQV